jgi:hypothetical protein
LGYAITSSQEYLVNIHRECRLVAFHDLDTYSSTD